MALSFAPRSSSICRRRSAPSFHVNGDKVHIWRQQSTCVNSSLPFVPDIRVADWRQCGEISSRCVDRRRGSRVTHDCQELFGAGHCREVANRPAAARRRSWKARSTPSAAFPPASGHFAGRHGTPGVALRSPRSDFKARVPNHFPGTGHFSGERSVDIADPFQVIFRTLRARFPCPRRISLRLKSNRFIGTLPGARRGSLDSCASVAGWRRIGVEVSGLTSASSRPQALTSSVSGEIRNWHDHCDDHPRIGKECTRGKLTM